ncbi:hypothetical protein PG984_010448 [Apiospora sp. TS-2023a]
MPFEPRNRIRQILHIGTTVLDEEERVLECRKYKYKPIGAERTTRMLILKNGSYEDELAGNLEMARLDDCPPWEALSYAWGTTTVYSRIRIGSRFIRISTNLEGALRKLRQKHGDEALGRGFRLWVDQICIDQENVQERSHQVQLMYSIYEKAEKVFVWLGPDDYDVAKEAFYTVRMLASLDENQTKELGTDQIHVLKDLFDCRWFRRLWVVQEIGTDTPAEFHWGQECIDFEIVHDARIERGVPTPQISHISSGFLNKASRKECIDPRDRVFALLGHYSARIGPNKHPIMEADYSSHPAVIYRELATRALIDAKSTIILNCVEHERK